MKNKFKLGKDILILTIFTFITILTWVGFEVWLSATRSTIPKVTKEQMAPLSPKIPQKIIESLKDNLSLSEEELNQIIISVPEATGSATESAEIESSQTGTESATLEENL